MEFWRAAYKSKSVSIDKVKRAVITEKNIFGEITKEQFKEITGLEYTEV